MKTPDNTWKKVFTKLTTTHLDILRKIAKHLSQREALLNVIGNICKEFEGKVLVEVGCGTAVECLLFSLGGARCLGVDREYGALKYADTVRRYFSRGPNLCQGNGFSIPVKSECADVVFSQGFIEHFTPKQSQELLIEQARILKKGGVLVIDVPNLHSTYELYKRIYSLFGPWIYGIERGISSSELTKFADLSGFKFIGRYGWSFKGYPYRTILDLIYMIPLLCVRNILKLFGKSHDSIGMVFRKEIAQ